MALTLLLGGGLGNQLFQYAAARSLALRLGVDLTIDTRFYPLSSPVGAKSLWLTHFPIHASLRSYDKSVLSPHHLLLRAYRKLFSERPGRRFQERSLGFHPEFFDLKDKSIISGNFQSPLYFEDVYDEFSCELDLLRAGHIEPTKNIDGIKVSEFIGVHVRRGDYLTEQGFAMPEADGYYRRALSLMREMRGEKSPVLIVSDDMGWCKSQTFFAGAMFLQSSKSDPPYKDLFLLSQCGGIIIANSSFSWWSAWFGSCRGASVIAPRMWISGKSTKYLNVVPNGWTIA